jgi:uncharacterized damage-inducible protein DinB
MHAREKMAQTLTDRYRRWFEYEKDSHAKVLASLESVPPENRALPAFAKAVTLLAHIVAARQLWLFRFGVAKESPTDFFPEGLSITELASQLSDVEAAWNSYLSRLDDDALSRVFTYQSLDSSRFKNTIDDILTQLFGHSWYHRGQIASLVRQAGGQPAATDFVYWTRAAVET